MYSTTILAAALLVTATTAYEMAAMDAVRFGVVRYPEMSLYRRQSEGGCHDNTKACSNFCIAFDEECCPDGTSCFNDERCQKGQDGVWGCCEKGTVCLGSVSTAADTASPTTATGSATTGGSGSSAVGGNPAAKGGKTSSSSGNGGRGAVPVQAAAAVAVGAWALL